MNASDCSFQDMMSMSAISLPRLKVLSSFVQVEEGLKDLEAHWQGFVDTSDFSHVTYTNKEHICSEFERQLGGQLSNGQETVLTCIRTRQ